MKYLIRLDDACPTMNRKKWEIIIDLLDKYQVKAIIAVIPKNEDPKMAIDKHDKAFWDKIRMLQKKGHQIALHGYNHVYTTNEAGIVPMNKKSEFAGVPLDLQSLKIKHGWEIFKNEGVKSKFWVAPSHTFDNNTLLALQAETTIRTISDGVAITPYMRDGFLWIPQQFWKFKEKKYGIWTGCFHPNMIVDDDIIQLNNFLKKNNKLFISDFSRLIEKYGETKNNIINRLYFRIFFLKKYLKSLRYC